MPGTATVRELLVAWGFEVDDAKLAALNKAIETTKQRAQSAGDRLRAMGNAMTTAGRRLTVGVTLPIVGIGAALVKAAADAEESEDKFRVVFKGAAAGVERWSEDFAKATGRSRFALRDMASDIGIRFGALGFSEDVVGKMSERLATLAIDIGSLQNKDPVEFVQTLLSALRGEAEPGARLGADIRKEAVLGELAAMAKNAEARKQLMGLTDAQKETLARYNIILRATKDAHGNATHTAGSLTNQMRAAQAAAHDSSIVMGQELVPATKEITARVREWAESFGELTKGEKKVLIELALIVALAGPAMLALGGIIKGVLAIGAAYKGIRAAILATHALMVANPMLLPLLGIAAAIGLVIAQWDEFRDAWRMLKIFADETWEALMTKMEAGIDRVTTFFRDAWEGMVKWFDDNVTKPIDRGLSSFLEKTGLGGVVKGLGGVEGPRFAPESSFAASSPARSAAAPAGAGGGANVNLQSNVNLNFGGGASTGERQQTAEAVRRVVRDENDRALRRARATMP